MSLEEMLILKLRSERKEKPVNLSYSKSIDIWINAALRKLKLEDKIGKIHWQLNEELSGVVARAKFLIIMNEKVFTYLEFSPTFFHNTQSQKQRREIVYHEVAHVVDSYCAGSSGGHNKNWKYLMKLAGVPAKTSYELIR
jgi:predicted SprT family Zn-dependent metalloprotease